MDIRNILLTIGLVALLTACGGGDYSPKPQAYLRIDMPQHEYFLLDTMRGYAGDTLFFNGDTAIALEGFTKTFPFTFEANECIEWTEKDAPKGERWIDLMYPKWDGVVFLSYRHLHSSDDLKEQIDGSMRFLEQHYQVASGVEEQGYADSENRVYGTVYYLKGSKVASTCQFWLTDSTSNFLRGSLFLNRTPNNDSLAPVLEYIQADIEHLVETLRWR